MPNAPIVQPGPNFGPRLRETIQRRGTVRTPTPYDDAGRVDWKAAHRRRKTVQAAGYASGYTGNWATHVGPKYITGMTADAARALPKAQTTVVSATRGANRSSPIRLDADPFGGLVGPPPDDLLPEVLRTDTRIEHRNGEWIILNRRGDTVSTHPTRSAARTARARLLSEVWT